MWFWDSSALVTLVLDERSSGYFRRLARGNASAVVWYYAPTEIAGVIFRKQREGKLDDDAVDAAQERLDRLSRTWLFVDAFTAVREAARELMSHHAITSADAMQLAAALVHVKGYARGHTFVVIDEGLEEAARAEGFDVVSPPARGRRRARRGEK